MRRHRMQERKRGVAVTVVIAGLDRRGKFERAATFRSNFSTAPWREGNDGSESGRTD
jgi:hypothetical protein